ncbi:MAG: hypothetical protein WD354_11930 [Acidimicrobiia bacterium]
MRLGIDLDGVVADFNRGWIDRYNRQYGTELPFDAVQSWDAIPHLTHFEDMGVFWDWARDHDGHTLFHHLETYPGALEALEALDRVGHDIVILTTKPDWAISDTYTWLGEHRIKTREVHILEDKWRVDCDVYLDDAPHNLRNLVAKRPDRVVCRFVRPWNSPIEGANDIIDWPEFVQSVASEGR